MIYPNIPLDRFLKKYKEIQVVKVPCKNCGEEIVTDIPFVAKEFVGLEAGPCSQCGHVQRCMTFLVHDPKEVAKWEGIV